MITCEIQVSPGLIAPSFPSAQAINPLSGAASGRHVITTRM